MRSFFDIGVFAMIATKNDLDGPAKGGGAGFVGGILATFVAAVVFLATIYYLKIHHAGTPVITGVALIYALVFIATGAYTSRMAYKAGKFRASSAKKRYNRRFNIAMAVYVVALIGALNAVIEYHLTGPIAYGLAILPALPLLSVIAIMGLYLREETDEFERSIMTEANLMASGGVLALATVWGFMELFDLAPHVQVWWAFPIWALLLAAGQVVARKRYR